jgi:hypothetical protein
MVTFCTKSRPIINGRLFLSISPITGLGLCERLILSSVWAVLFHKAGGRVHSGPLRLWGKQASRMDFWIVWSGRSASSPSK